MAQFATVAAITGNGSVLAVDVQGRTRVLKVGDTLQKGETVRTVGDVRVELLMEDGSLLAVAPAQSIRLDENVVQSDQRPTAQDSAVTTPATADAVIQALERGTDLNQSLEATAAGLVPGGGVDGGSSFVQLLRIAEGVSPLAYEYNFVPPELQPDIESIPEPVPPTVSVGVTVGVQVGVGEGGPGLITGEMIQGTVSTADVIEGSGGGSKAVTFLITLNQVSTTDVTVTYTIVPGTASNPADYFDGAVTGTVTIPAGYIGFFVTENIVGDILVEGNETFTIVLSNPIGATLINDTATVTIIDDDHAPVAVDDSNSLTEDQISVSGNVIPNDTDADGQTLSVVGPSITATNAYGTLVIDSATGGYTFTLNEATQAAAQALDDGESINMVFADVYQVTDGANLSNLADVSITITGTNDGPIITADPGNEGGNDVVYESGLAIGSDAAAGTEFAFGTFTVSDADGLDDIQSVTINGVTVAIGSLVGQSFAGTNGTLTVTAYDAGTGVASYTYELTSPTTDVDGTETDVFTLTTSDGTATSAPAAITIEIIDDVPTARADTDSVAEGADTTGNVLTGAGTTSGGAGADTAGADGFGAGAVVGVAAGSNTAVPVSGGVGGGIAGTYGTLTLNADGSYTYEANPDAVTSNQTDTFVYTIVDGDGDLSTTTLTISVNNVTVTASDTDALVNEAGLPVVGSDAASNSEIFNGAITPSGGTGPYTYTLTSTANGAYGNLVLNADGTYTYTLDTTFDGATLNNGVTTEQDKDSFSYTVTDANGNTTTGTILVDIIDDVPTARADTDSVNEGADTTGNVLTGAGTTSGGAGADTAGADGFGAGAVVGVAAGSNTAVPVSGGVGGGIAGTYGTLTLNADGSYTYEANPDAVTSNQTDTFVYTIVDGDGDLSTTTLTISVNNVTVTASDTDALVNEAGLPVVGSDAASNSEIFNGAITPSGGTGPYTYTLTSTANGAYGNLVLNADGTYTYTLDTTFDGATLNNGVTTEQDKDSFSYTVTDANGNSTTGTILVDIIDDVPTARADTDSVNEGADTTGNVLTGAGTTSGGAGADTAGADGFGAGAVVGVAAGSNTAVPVSGGVGGGIAGTYGTLTLNADGSYTYEANPDAVTSNQTDTFVYTIVDGDGDLSTTTLTISVNNVTVTASDTDALVNEAGLPVVGSDAASNSEIFNGAITPSGGTGPYTYTLTSTANGAYGNLVLNADGTYTYTLDTTFDGATLNNGVTTEQDKDSFSYTVTDANGNTTTGTILVDIIDDVPVVLDKTDLIYSNSSNPSPGGTGVFDYIIGADSRTTFSSSDSDFSAITLAGMVGATAISTPSVTWASEDSNEAVFDVQFSYAANPLTPGVLTEANGTLTFDKVSGTYELTLDEPIESFSILTTSGTLSKESYNLVGPSEAQPEIVVSKLAEEFFVRFTGGEEQGGGPVDFKSSDGNTAFTNGETFVGAQAWVSISGSSNGVSSDTLQAGEVLNMDFYNSSPGSNGTPGPGTATANGIYLKLDQLGAGEDFVVILKLVDASDPTITTTRAIVIDYADIYLSSESNPYGITFVDDSDGVVIIESNDYNSGGSNWVINGVQLLVSTETVTGSGIDLNRATGDAGGSSGTDVFGSDTVDNDVIKISDIGIISTTSDTQDASLDFSFTLVDADGDNTASQTLSVTIEGSSTFEGTASAESITGDGSANVLIGGAGNDILEGGGGADVFKWSLTDQGTVGTPAADVVTDFAAGDTLNLLDLLPGAPGTDLTQYLDVTQEAGGIMIHVTDGTGAASTNDVQTILLASYTTTDTVTDILNELKATQQYTG
ncbi:retention module-containing protein [Polaromonas sp. JS666]|uniref:retention module-containing protein n=1 Tax=Polaromonas sp. (strain JS666 / ATCC BAA-500) TaxID=296591 RepID=UPI0000D5B348|nr:retention module-containing protein [Polaromonas sp. JS666]ABE42269.1 conserved hypothetical protein [Polaromonas sp. JS666]